MPLHPALHALTIRTGRSKGARIGLAAIVLLVLAAALPWPDAHMPRLQAITQWLAAQPLPVAVLSALAMHAVAAPPLRRELGRWRHGLWAALPVPEGRVLAGAALLSAVAALLVALVIWCAMRIAADASGGGSVSFGAVLGGCIVAAAVACIRGLSRVAPAVAAIPVRRPLWNASLLADARLPHLADWQRRETVQRWRGRTAAPVIGGLLLAMPSGTGLRGGIGVVLVSLAAWCLAALAGSLRVHRDAGRLLRAQPLRNPVLALAALRYPAFAVGWTMLLMAIIVVAAGRALR